MVCACSHGSTKLVSWVSKITEYPISHRSFSLEIMYNMSEQSSVTYCHRKKNHVTETNLSQKKLHQSKITLSKIVSTTEPSFGHRNKICLSYSRINTFLSEKKFLSQKTVSVTENHNISEKKIFRNRRKLMSQKKFRHRYKLP